MAKSGVAPESAYRVKHEVIGPEGMADLLGCQDEAAMHGQTAVEYAVCGSIGLNLRTTPSLDGAVVAVLPPGCGVLVQGEPDGEWVRVRTGRLDGYVMAQYLSPLAPQTKHDDVV